MSRKVQKDDIVRFKKNKQNEQNKSKSAFSPKCFFTMLIFSERQEFIIQIKKFKSRIT